MNREGYVADRLSSAESVGTASISRRGAVLVIAMMCLLLAGVVVVSLVQGAVRQQEQVARDEWQVQANWPTGPS